MIEDCTVVGQRRQSPLIRHRIIFTYESRRVSNPTEDYELFWQYTAWNERIVVWLFLTLRRTVVGRLISQTDQAHWWCNCGNYRVRISPDTFGLKLIIRH